MACQSRHGYDVQHSHAATLLHLCQAAQGRPSLLGRELAGVRKSRVALDLLLVTQLVCIIQQLATCLSCSRGCWTVLPELVSLQQVFRPAPCLFGSYCAPVMTHVVLLIAVACSGRCQAQIRCLVLPGRCDVSQGFLWPRIMLWQLLLRETQA